MIGTQLYSPANPIQGTAGATQGIKPIDNVITLSVGTAGAIGSYITKNSAGDPLTASIKNGVLEFSYPQTNPYIGIGDKVLAIGFSNSTYLKKKISQTKWEVFQLASNIPAPAPNTDATAVIDINKAFNTLLAAEQFINLHFNHDLISERMVVQIACYAMTDTTVVHLMETAWTTNPDFYIRVFTPNDLRTECNKIQRPTKDDLTTAYINTGYIYSQSDNIVLDGLNISGSAGLQLGSASGPLTGGEITNCVFGDNGITNIGTAATPVLIVNNIFYNGAGIYLTGYQDVTYNNTLYNGSIQTNGIFSRCINNIAAGTTGTINVTSLGSLVSNCVSYAALSGTNCFGGVTYMVFKDPAMLDFRIDQRCPLIPGSSGPLVDDFIVRGGLDLSTDSYYPVTKDIFGEPVDNTPSVGAYHYVREFKMAVGTPVIDLKGSITTMSITGGVMTLNFAGDSRMCSGCLVSTASGWYILHEMITPTTWYVTKQDPGAQGRVPADIGLTTVYNIKVFSDLHDAINTVGGTSLLSSFAGEDFPALDLKVTIFCSYGQEAAQITIGGPPYTFDRTRSLSVIAADNRRHSGVFDPTLWNLKVTSAFGIINQCEWTSFEYLQLSAAIGLSLSEGARHNTIESNIIYGCSQCGVDKIFPADSNEPESVYVIKNIIYKCAVGISLRDNPVAVDPIREQYYAFVYNNTLVNNGKGVFIFSEPYNTHSLVTRMVNNLEQGSTEYGYWCSTYDPEWVIAESNWASDLSLEKFQGINNTSSAVAEFYSAFGNDYRIMLYTSILMTDVVDTACDPDYPVSCTNHFGKLDIGAMGWAISSDRIANYSVGATTTDLTLLPGLYATLHNDVIKFTVNDSLGAEADISDLVGIGDIVTFAGGLQGCLAERGNQYTWAIRDITGINIGSSDAHGTVTSFKRCANNLADAFGTKLSTLFAGGTGSVNVWFYKEAIDTTSATISGWSCDETHRLVLQTPWNKNTQANKSQRHLGTAATGYTFTNNNPIIINNTYVDIKGFVINGVSHIPTQVGDWDASSYGIVIESTGGTYVVEGNVMFHYGVAITQQPTAGECRIVNNIIYDVMTGVLATTSYVYNNTVMNPSSVGIHLDAGAGINNIVDYTGTSPTNCYEGTAVPANLTKCISGDFTGSTDYQDMTLTFLNAAGKDFHLNRIDWFALNNGEDLSADAQYPFHHDIDMQELSQGELPDWSIGADSNPAVEPLKLYFSAGLVHDDLISISGVKISILNGVATFTSKLVDNSALGHEIGVGNKIVYNISDVCYLTEKIDSRNWSVATKYGVAPANISNSAIVSFKHPYFDIGHAFTGEHAPLEDNSVATNLGIPEVHTFNSLINARYQINIAVYKKDSTSWSASAINIHASDYEANEDYYFRVYTPVDTGKECNERQRNNGWFNPNNLALYAPNLIDPAIDITLPYTVIEGLIISGTTATTAIPLSGACVGARIDGNIIYNCANSAIQDTSTNKNIFVNNVISTVDGFGINANGYSIVYNNTLYACAFGIRSGGTGDVFYNNIVQASTDSDYIFPGGMPTVMSNVGHDGTLSGSDYSNFPFLTLAFKDVANNDLNLNQTAADDLRARSSAVQLTADSNYAFNTDLTGRPRDSRWDRGALEYRPFRACLAVSTGEDVQTKIGILDYQIVINHDGESIVTFTGISGHEILQIHPLMGVGNLVTDMAHAFDYDGCLIKEKITQSSWIVTTYSGDPVTASSSGSVYQISSVDTSLTRAVSNLFYKDLAARNLAIDIACYNIPGGDSSSGIEATISGIASDYDCRLRIYSPYDIDKEVNVKQRHNGQIDSGYVFKVSSWSSPTYAIGIINSNYTCIEGLITTPFNQLGQCDGISVSNSCGVEIIGNIVYGFPGHGIKVATRMNVDPNHDFIINNLVFSCRDNGVTAGHPGTSTSDNVFTHILNNTVYGCYRGINFIGGAFGINATPEMNYTKAVLINNIYQKSSYTDFVLDNRKTSIGALSSEMYGVTSDSSGREAGVINSTYHDRILNFQNKAVSDFELDLTHDFPAIDTGENLSTYPQYAFSTDIALRPRNDGHWDRGAFEFTQVNGSGDLTLNSVTMECIAEATDDAPTFDLYLRLNEQHFLESVPFTVQFCDTPGMTAVENLNAYLASVDQAHLIAFNLVIHIEGGQAFAGQFVLKNREPRTVTIVTQAGEEHLGLGSIAYDEGLVDDASVQGALIFDGVKLYTEDDYYLLGNTTRTTMIKFLNSIVQVWGSKICPSSTVNVISENSLLIFLNELNSSAISLSNNDGAHSYIANSILLASNSGTNPVTLMTGSLGYKTVVRNTLTYNINGAAFNINALVDYANCQLSTDPLFVDSSPYEMATSAFIPSVLSPVVNAGDNAYVEGLVVIDGTTIPITYSDVLKEDAAGNVRIFDSNVLDVGPYELEVRTLHFTSKDVTAVYQDKLVQQPGSTNYISYNKKIAFTGLYDKFNEDVAGRDDFFRESKIIMSVDIPVKTYRLYNDKGDQPIQKFDAYYDSDSNSIVISKDQNFNGNFFGKAFGDERFVFHYIESIHTLYVFVNDTFYKGASGGKNPVKNVQFGGSSVLIN